MEYIHAALLLHKLGKSVNEVNVKKVMESAGAHVEEAKVKALVTSLENIDIEKVIKEASVMPSVAMPAQPVAEAKEEEHKEEKKSEEVAVSGLGSLFG